MLRRARLSAFERACAAITLVALASRLMVFQFRNVNWDTMWYLTMGKSFVEHGEFLSPWFDPPKYTQHFPPAYPLLEAAAYALGGPTFAAAAAVAILVAGFLAVVTFLTTRDLFGRPHAFAVTAIVSTSTILAELDLTFYSESLVAAFFALTVWGILKSLDDPRYILAAGLFAGLGYLTKASMGPFFLLAGAGGFAWRFYYVRWRVFRDRWYLGAALVFAAFVVTWAGRNVLRHGWPHWQTQPYADEAFRHLFARPDWPVFLGAVALWGLVILSVLMLGFLPEILASLRRIRDERTSALWLAIVTPTVIGIIFAAAFASIERRLIVTDAAIRYLVTPLVPIVWLGTRHLDLGEPAPATPPTHGRSVIRSHLGWLLAGGGLLALLHFVNPILPGLTIRRFTIYVLVCAIGITLLLVARRHAWKPTLRTGAGGATTWRAERAPLAGAPPALFVLAAVAFSIGIGLLVAYEFLAFLVPLAVSLAAGSPRARVLVLAGVSVVVPFSMTLPESTIIQAAEDLNAIAAEGDVVAAYRSQEFYVYPWLRSDLQMVTPERPHDWLLLYGGKSPADEGVEYELVQDYVSHYVRAPGLRLGMTFWSAVLDERNPDRAVLDARLYRVVEPPSP